MLGEVELQNFRNYKKASFEFSSGISLIVGPNASGKTNLLEAIFLLATGKTFRPGLEREMVRFGEEVGRVRGIVSKSIRNWESGISEGTDSEFQVPNTDTDRVELEVVLTRGKVLGKKAPLKKLLVNGVSRRLYDFVGNLVVVLFGPEDLQLVTNSPALRRDFLDFVLEQVDREYRRRSLVYKKGLVQRNKLLRLIAEGKRRKEELAYWNNLLVENGSYITKKRAEFFEFVNSLPKELGEFEFVYQPSIFFDWVNRQKALVGGTKSRSGDGLGFQDLQTLFKNRLEEVYSQEIKLGMSLVGPHRDEFKFQIPNSKSHPEPEQSSVRGSPEPCSALVQGQRRDLSIFGSRGEQRKAVLALKLAQLEFMTKVLGERPILLLDDIFSEFDFENRKELLEVIPKQQTIITTTDLGLIPEDFLGRMKVWRVGERVTT